MKSVRRACPRFDEKNLPDPAVIHQQGEKTRKMSHPDAWHIINTIRCLAADVVQGAKSGHPGAPMGLAPTAHVLFSNFLRFNPSNPKWIARDRFVLSNGHACALQYIMLHLTGYDVTMEDLQQFRKVHSRTPGHPECFLTPGVEVSSGPLGQGFANAVGLAIAEKHLASMYNRPDFEIVNNYTYCFAGDGCLQEGVSSEVASLAGHLGLGKLIVIYDDNHVQIDGSTEMAFTEDVTKRFEAYGWHTLHVEDGDNDLLGIQGAIDEAKRVTDRPSLIKVTTIIGYGSKSQGTEKVHGAALGDEVVANVKKLLGFDPAKFYRVDDKVRELYSPFKVLGIAAEKAWNDLFDSYAARFPDLAQQFRRRMKGELPPNWKEVLPKTWPDKPLATRKTSEQVLQALAQILPEIVGGAADLQSSTLTKIGEDFQRNTPGNRVIRFGVREHAMMAICNGLYAYGGFIPFGSTFLNFLEYGYPAFRLAALSHFGVLAIMTHDSVGLGEDGPTHQPIEMLEATRATPNVLTMRPADGNETAGCYLVAIENRVSPSVIALSRQELPQLQGTSCEKVALGAYTVRDVAIPQVILVATGSEVSLCVEAAKLLEAHSTRIRARVVSMPITQLYDRQTIDFKKALFPEGVPVISVEAASTRGWAKYAHVNIGIDRFGLSAPYKDVFKALGLVPEVIAEKALKVLQFYQHTPVPSLFNRPAIE